MTIERMLQILETYSPGEVWKTFDSQTGVTDVVDSTNPTYFAGIIYDINDVNSPLHEYLIFCLAPVYSPVDWTQYDFTNGNIQRLDTLHIPSEFRVVLKPSERDDAITEAASLTNFVPFSDLQSAETAPSVVIGESELHIILRDAGVPFVKWEELEYDVDTMKYLIVRPAIEQFYKYFPIIRPETIPVQAQGRFSADYPDDPNFVMVRSIAGTNAAQATEGSGMGNPFQYYRDQMIGGLFMGGHAFGRPQGRAGRAGRVSRMAFNHNDIVSNLQHQATYNSMLNRYSRVKYTINETGVEGYHTGGRYVTIEWGFMSPDWSAIPHARKLEVRDLAAAYALRTFGMLRMQTPDNSPGKIDYASWLSRADELEEKVLTHWHEFTRAIVIRNR